MSRILQPPPYDEAAEIAVLGSVFQNKNCFSCVQGILTSDDFYYRKHQIIFECMATLHEQATPIDPVTLGTEIARRHELNQIGGAKYLSNLIDDVATSANVEHYAKIVRDLSQKREMITVGREIADSGYKPDVTTSDYLSESRAKVLTVADQMSARLSPLAVGETIEKAYENAVKTTEPEGLVRTKMPIDRVFGGLHPGLLTVLASRPSMGKSCMAVNIATNAALSGKNTLLVSLEDTRHFVQIRMMARLAKVDLDHIIEQKFSEEEKQRLLAAKKIIFTLPLWIEDNGSMSSDEIRRMSMAFADKHNIDLVIIDHLGHINEPGSNLYESTTKAVRTINQIPKELNIPVLLLHQLNRGPENRDCTIPRLSDLRQSGEVEQLARVVWLLHRPAYYDPENANPNELKLVVAKNSHGKTGNMKLYCNMAQMYISGQSDAN